MALKKALVALCLGSAAAFNPRAKAQVKAASKQLAAGVLAVAAALPVAPALAADSLVLGTPLEEKLAAFGAASYPVVNSITDAGALADKFIEFIDAKVKPADASAVVNKAVDGLLAQHLMMNVLAKRAGKKLYKKDGRCKWDDEDLKIAEKGMCVAEDLVETIAPYARAHAEKLAQAVSSE